MWYTIDGHDEVAEQFRRTLQSGRLASTYLFVGPEGIGKRSFAHQLAQCLLCQRRKAEELTICDECHSCRLVRAGNHPDLLQVGLPADKTVLPIELFVGDRDHRHQEGLCHELSLKPSFGMRRVAVIDDADLLSQESANCLLKTLEEPPPRSVLILVGTSPGRQLPTIRSRSQLVRFRPLSAAITARLIREHGIEDDPSQAARIAALCEGSLLRARELKDAELDAFRDLLHSAIHRTPLETVQLANRTNDFVTAAGQEASERRGRLRFVLRTAADAFRNQMLSDLSEAAADKIDACLEALELLDRNINQTTLVHWWAERLGSCRD